jgi:hypothetical protein
MGNLQSGHFKLALAAPDLLLFPSDVEEQVPYGR